MGKEQGGFWQRVTVKSKEITIRVSRIVKTGIREYPKVPAILDPELHRLIWESQTHDPK